jgi:hypothetical protein
LYPFNHRISVSPINQLPGAAASRKEVLCKSNRICLSTACDQAIEFYETTLGAEVTMLMRFKDAPEPPPPGMLPFQALADGGKVKQPLSEPFFALNSEWSSTISAYRGWYSFRPGAKP